LLKHALDTYHFTEEEIWAADETGIDEHGKCKKVIARRGTNTQSNIMQKNDSMSSASK
jgi:hypothetical protein